MERAIREAMERGDFDDLPGAGKPLPPINPDDPDWFVRQLAAREHLDFTGALPPAIALRKEAAGFPDSLVDLGAEESVRAVLVDFNARVRQDRLRPAQGRLPPILAPTVDVEAMVAGWRELRDRHAHGSAAERAGTPPSDIQQVDYHGEPRSGSEAPHRRRRRWFWRTRDER